eukprot:m.411174 g.411174  ORF g.411174 m.411174 type:complete len:115 (+) comp20163_c0_seq2:779-1123(+)
MPFSTSAEGARFNGMILGLSDAGRGGGTAPDGGSLSPTIDLGRARCARGGSLLVGTRPRTATGRPFFDFGLRLEGLGGSLRGGASTPTASCVAMFTKDQFKAQRGAQGLGAHGR